MLELCCALAMRIKAQRHTKAQVQPAIEGVLDSECEGAARWEFRRRRFKSIPVTAARSGGQFHTGLMWNQRQFLCMLRGVLRDRSNGGVLSLELAAWTARAHFKRATSLRHRATAVGLTRIPQTEQARGHRRCGPEDHN